MAEETGTSIPPQVAALESLPVIHKEVISAAEMADNIKRSLGIIQ